MKLFRRITFSLLAASALLIVSCAKDDTNPPVSDDRTKFLGDWKCMEQSSQSGPSTFNVHIASFGSSEITISNFYYYGDNTLVKATVNGNSLTIPKQTVSGNSASGSGTMSATNVINMKYYIDKGAGDIDTCTAKLNKL